MGLKTNISHRARVPHTVKVSLTVEISLTADTRTVAITLIRTHYCVSEPIEGRGQPECFPKVLTLPLDDIRRANKSLSGTMVVVCIEGR